MQDRLEGIEQNFRGEKGRQGGVHTDVLRCQSDPLLRLGALFLLQAPLPVRQELKGQPLDQQPRNTIRIKSKSPEEFVKRKLPKDIFRHAQGYTRSE